MSLPWDERPPFCTEKNCKMIMNPQSLSEKTIDKGFSGVCCGRIIDPEKVVLTAGEVEHKNYVYFCIYTPFKGWSKFMLNENDVFAIELCMQHFRKEMKWRR